MCSESLKRLYGLIAALYYAAVDYINWKSDMNTAIMWF